MDMKFFTTDAYGLTLVEPNAQQRKSVLESVLEDADEAEFPEAYLSGLNGKVIGFRADGCLFYEESGTVTRYMLDIDLNTAMVAWNLLIDADWNQLDKMDWKSIE